jgi:hypothetical protein
MSARNDKLFLLRGKRDHYWNLQGSMDMYEYNLCVLDANTLRLSRFYSHPEDNIDFCWYFKRPDVKRLERRER